MLSSSTSDYIQLSIVCMLIALAFTLAVFGIIVLSIHCWRRKRQHEYERLPLVKTTGTNLTVKSKVYHFLDKTILFSDDEPCQLKYLMAHFNISQQGKFSIKVNSLLIGGFGNSLKAYIPILNQVFFRILMNNNFFNSIIVSEKYNFANKIDIDEIFIFKIQEYQLKDTSVTIEVFSTLTDRNDEFVIGWIDIYLPEDTEMLPTENKQDLQMPNLELDLFQKPVGYLCVSLSSIKDKIKVDILATSYMIFGIDTSELENYSVYFILKSENEKIIEVYKASTMFRKFKPTIIWNETFIFDVPDDLKSSNSINIYLWKTGALLSVANDPPKKIGSVKLGLGYSFTRKCEDHCNYVLLNNGKEKAVWHCIQMHGK